MEFLIVVGLLSGVAVFFMGGAIWLWIALLLAASYVGFRAYRVRCKACGKKVISGLDMKYCNQCGAQQNETRGVRLRCHSCKALTRSELNLAYCNQCGVKVSV